jgi:hypothetical protein
MYALSGRDMAHAKNHSVKKGKTMNIGRSLSIIFSFVAITVLGGTAAGSALSARQDQNKKVPATNQSIAGEWSVTVTEFG